MARPVRPSRRARASIIAAAQDGGCTCRRPDVELVQWHSDLVTQYRMAHEAGCPAIGQDTVAFLLPLGGGS